MGADRGWHQGFDSDNRDCVYPICESVIHGKLAIGIESPYLGSAHGGWEARLEIKCISLPSDENDCTIFVGCPGTGICCIANRISEAFKSCLKGDLANAVYYWKAQKIEGNSWCRSGCLKSGLSDNRPLA